MRARLPILLAAALAVAAFAASSASAAMIGIYRNELDSLGQRSQLVKLSGRSCARGGVENGLRIKLGKRTEACAYRTPVLGRDLEVASSQRLLSGTPKALQRKAYLGVELRAGGGAKYQLLVFPLQRKAQLIKVTADGTKYLAIAKDLKSVMGLNKANALRLRAVNTRSGPERGQAKLFAFLGREQVLEAVDPQGGELTGKASGLVIGATKQNAEGVVASVDNVLIRVPSPFEG